MVNFTTNEKLFCAFTLTGGSLVQRHWEESNKSEFIICQWGHRTIAVIEAIPVLGIIAALIETIFVNFLINESSKNKNELARFVTDSPLEFDTPTLIAKADLLSLAICGHNMKSGLAVYADSVFECSVAEDSNYIITRKKIPLPTLKGVVVNIPPMLGPQNTQDLLIHEGVKVRTFCLKLLDEIEKLIISKSEDLRLIECKILLTHYIEKWALDKKMGFSDYLKLLEILNTSSAELDALLKHHQAIVELQNKLPKKLAKKFSHWHKIREMVRLKLFEKNISITAPLALEIGLHPIPALPIKQTIVNLYPTLDAINLLEQEYRDAGRWVMHHMRVITLSELIQSIKSSCEKIRDRVLNWGEYQILIVEEKSQEWMADLAYRFLPSEKMPKGLIKASSGSTLAVGEALFNHLKSSPLSNVLMFDDGAYTGTQLQEYLNALKANLVKTNTRFENTRSIYFILGYSPQNLDWQEYVNVLDFAYFNLHVEVITSHYIATPDALKNKENLSNELKRQIKDLTGSKTMIVTEWKKPDFVSTPIFATKGAPPYDLLRNDISGLRDHKSLLAGECNSSLSLNGIGPITDVYPPYKKV